jgi:hypothetical protein
MVRFGFMRVEVAKPNATKFLLQDVKGELHRNGNYCHL